MNELTKIAMVGTSKASAMPLDAPLKGDWAGLGLERERELLLRAGADAAIRAAAYRAPDGVELPTSAADETLPICSDAVASLLDPLIKAQVSPVFVEALELLAARKQRVQPALLPRLLDVKDGNARALLLPLLGERGRWLSQFREEWRWASEDVAHTLPPDAEAIWQEGTPSDRLRVLKLGRAERPAEARGWLEAVWREEKADFRKQALAVLETGLSRDDEPLLERALDDRSSSVREVAAVLLGRLDGSAFRQRMTERADAMLLYTPPGRVNRLQRFVQSVTAAKSHGTFRLELPTNLDAAWKRDGIDDAGARGIGKGAWMFIQIVGAVPLRRWEQRCSATPDDLVAAAMADKDAALTLLHAWSAAAERFDDSRWALPLWNAWRTVPITVPAYANIRRAFLRTLAVRIAPSEVERLSLALVARKDKDVDTDTRVGLIDALPRPWSVEFSRVFLDAVTQKQTSIAIYEWSEALSWAEVALPPAMFDEALRRLEPAFEESKAWQLRKIVDTIDQRQRLYKEIAR